jgi:hypothetical protein
MKSSQTEVDLCQEIYLSDNPSLPANALRRFAETRSEDFRARIQPLLTGKSGFCYTREIYRAVGFAHEADIFLDGDNWLDWTDYVMPEDYDKNDKPN